MPEQKPPVKRLNAKKSSRSGYAPPDQTKYKPEYCQLLIDHMDEGKSFDSFAGVVKVVPATLFYWTKKYPEFKAAKEIGFSSAIGKWEQRGIDIAENGGGNGSAAMVSMMLRNYGRGKSPYAEQSKRVELTGKDGGAIEHASYDLTKLSTEKLEQIALLLSSAKKDGAEDEDGNIVFPKTIEGEIE